MTTYAVSFVLWQQNRQGNPVLIEVIYLALSRCSLFLYMKSHENTSKYVDTVTLFEKTWTKGHWPLDDFWPHICWGLMCDSTQGSLCPSPMKIHQSMWIQWPFLQKNLNQRSLTPRWPLTPHLLRSHVWLYPRIIVLIHQCMWIQWSILQITTYIHILHNTTYRISDHIVSFWTTFRWDKNTKSPNRQMSYFSPLCKLQLSISHNRHMQLIPRFVGVHHIYENDLT